MDKAKKNRSGSMSNADSKNESGPDRKRNELPGSPAKSNRQTGGSRRNEKDDSNGSEKNTTKRQGNSI